MSVSAKPREFPNSTRAWKYLKKNAASTKVRELRERLANDIQRIRSRKRSETILPVPSDQQEEYFAKLENNWIWEKVFHNVSNLSDMTSACVASNIFRVHVEKKQVSILLPKVLEVLRNYKYLHVMRLDGRNIRNLRPVSKAWKEAVEAQYLTPVGFLEPDWHFCRDDITNKMVMFSPYCFIPTNIKRVESAMEVLRKSQSIPILLRVVYIDLNKVRDSEKETFISKLGELLDIHGKHVWSLHLVSFWFDYKCLWNFVSLTSSLKELVVMSCEDLLILSEDDERTLLAEFPFPEIPSLTRLTLFRIPDCKLLTSEIVRRNANLKTLSIHCGITPSLLELSPALTSLSLECFDFNLLEPTNMTLDTIRPLGQMQWPLRILNLSWTFGVGYLPEVQASHFFEILNQFKDRLEEFSVDTMILRDDGRKVVVQFPKLKKIDKVVVGL